LQNTSKLHGCTEQYDFEQYDLRRGYSTALPLLKSCDHLLTEIGNNLATAVFLYLKKAFDAVDHQILLNKLYQYGVSDVANDLFRSYLDNKKQFLFVNQQRSNRNSLL